MKLNSLQKPPSNNGLKLGKGLKKRLVPLLFYFKLFKKKQIISLAGKY